MVEDRIRNLETRVQESATLPATAKAELLELLGEVRAELEGVRQEHLQAAEEAGGRVGEEDVLEGLRGTVRELEAMHPRLSELVNRLAVALGNMGI